MRSRMAFNSVSSGWGRGTKLAGPSPSPSRQNTPSGISVWKWTFKLSAPPNLWIAVTPPQRILVLVGRSRRADLCCQAKIHWVKILSSRETSGRWRAARKRVRLGKERTHCRKGTAGNTFVRRCSALSSSKAQVQSVDLKGSQIFGSHTIHQFRAPEREPYRLTAEAALFRPSSKTLL